MFHIAPLSGRFVTASLLSLSVTQNTGALKKGEKEQKLRGNNFQLRFGKTEDGVCGETAEGL